MVLVKLAHYMEEHWKWIPSCHHPQAGKNFRNSEGKNNDYIKDFFSVKDIVRKVGRQVTEQMILAKPETEIDIWPIQWNPANHRKRYHCQYNDGPQTGTGTLLKAGKYVKRCWKSNKCKWRARTSHILDCKTGNS